MRRFGYRQTRVSVDLPAQFSTAKETLVARCTDISLKGMKLRFTKTIGPVGCGTVYLRYQNEAVELNARVVHTGLEHVGLEFLCDSEADQSTVAHLVTSLLPHHHQHLIFLVPKIRISLGPRSTLG